MHLPWTVDTEVGHKYFSKAILDNNQESFGCPLFLSVWLKLTIIIYWRRLRFSFPFSLLVWHGLTKEAEIFFRCLIALICCIKDTFHSFCPFPNYFSISEQYVRTLLLLNFQLIPVLWPYSKCMFPVALNFYDRVYELYAFSVRWVYFLELCLSLLLFLYFLYNVNPKFYRFLLRSGIFRDFMFHFVIDVYCV